MKVGSLVYATEQGLGILAKSFYDAGVVTDVLVVRHHHHRTYRDWYPLAPQTAIRPFDRVLIEKFCGTMDVMLFFETPFDWSLIPWCRKNGVRTALMPMHECMPKAWPYHPDIVINPSLLDQQCFPEGMLIPVPVQVPWRLRTRAEVFVHNAGHGGLKGRNGTGELLDAWQLFVESPAKLILRTQKPLQWDVADPRIEVRVGNFPYGELWDEGDAFVFPETFNGLSLPLQEAMASGMAVLATCRYPNTEYLPRKHLIPSQESYMDSIGPAYSQFERAVVRPEDIAATVDELYGADITDYSYAGREWARSMSWDELKPRYMRALCG